MMRTRISKAARGLVAASLLTGAVVTVASAQDLDRDGRAMEVDRDGGFDLGWLGLLGLAGLAGLKGRDKVRTAYPTSSTTARPA